MPTFIFSYLETNDQYFMSILVERRKNHDDQNETK